MRRATAAALLLGAIAGAAVFNLAHSTSRAIEAPRERGELVRVVVPPPRADADGADDDSVRVNWFEAEAPMYPLLSERREAPDSAAAAMVRIARAFLAHASAEETVSRIRKATEEKACHAPGCWWQAKPEAAAAIRALQDAAKEAMETKYGAGPHVVRLGLRFPDSMGGGGGALLFRVATSVPYSALFFLERVLPFAKDDGGTFQQRGTFHRNAPHVLQASLVGTGPARLAFQEKGFAHDKYTLGYAGRPGGASAIYVNSADNVRNHGGDRKGEPDAIFGELLLSSRPTVDRMKTQPGADPPNGFVSKKEHHIKITGIELLSGADREGALAAEPLRPGR